jgi:hypothetical protein
MTDLIAELAEVVRLQRLVDATYGCECENAMEDRDNAAVNFLRTHAAEIEAMARDAVRYRWLRGLESQFMLKRYGCGDLPMEDDLDEAIDAMHDSAREDGSHD